jgi:hypothetical protein
MGMILDGIELPVCCGVGMELFPYDGDIIITCQGYTQYFGITSRKHHCGQSKRLSQLQDGILWEDCGYCGGDLYEETMKSVKDGSEDFIVCEGCFEKHNDNFDAESFEAKGYAPDKPFYATTHENAPTTVMHPIKCGHYKMVMNGTGVWMSPTFYDTIEEMFTDKFDDIMETQAEGMTDNRQGYLDTEQGQEVKRKYQAIKTIGDARKFAKRYGFKIDFAPCFRKERDYDSKALNALPITVAPIYDEDSFESETFEATAYSMIEHQDDNCLEEIADSLRPKYGLEYNEGVLEWGFGYKSGDVTLYIYDGEGRQLDIITYDRKALAKALKEQGHKNPESWGAEYFAADGDSPSDREIVFKYYTQWFNGVGEDEFLEYTGAYKPIQALNALSPKDLKVIADEQREFYEAETKKINPIEKAGLTGIASGATMEGLETLLAAEEEELSEEKLSAYFARLKDKNPDLAKKIEYSIKDESYLPTVEITNAGFDDEIIEAWVDLVGVEDENLQPYESCSTCEGEGYVLTSYTSATRFDPADGDGEDCEECGGTGMIDPSDYMDKEGQYYAETFEANSGKRMYCPKCQKNRTWNRGFKKEKMESGENPYDFVFYICQKCDYAYDSKTSKEIVDWRTKFGYGAEEKESIIKSPYLWGLGIVGILGYAFTRKLY